MFHDISAFERTVHTTVENLELRASRLRHGQNKAEGSEKKRVDYLDKPRKLQ
jgi:hypothetical protein